MDVNLEGDSKIHNWKLPIPKAKANDVDVDWDNPQTAKLGLKYRLDDKNLLFLSAGWEDWSKFSQNTLALKGGQFNPEIRLDREMDDTWNAGIALAHHEGQPWRPDSNKRVSGDPGASHIVRYHARNGWCHWVEFIDRHLAGTG